MFGLQNRILVSVTWDFFNFIFLSIDFFFFFLISLWLYGFLSHFRDPTSFHQYTIEIKRSRQWINTNFCCIFFFGFEIVNLKFCLSAKKSKNSIEILKLETLNVLKIVKFLNNKLNLTFSDA